MSAFKTALQPHRRSESGAVAIIMAASLTMLLVAAALVLDFGIVRLDRQTNKSAADSAATSGLQGLNFHNDGKIYAFRGACAAFEALKSNEPALSGLIWSDCSDSAKLDLECSPSNAATHADYVATSGDYRVEIHAPYDVTEGGFPEEELETLENDAGDDELGGCDQLAVIVEQARTPGLGSLATSGDLVSRVRSVGRVTIESDTENAVALLLLEQRDCDAIVINGSNSFVRVRANGDSPGFIHSDSLGDVCTGQQRILVGEHANGIVAEQTGGADPTPGLIRVRAIGTPTAIRAYDSLANVVAQGGTPTAGGLVTRLPVDTRYISAARNAVSDYNMQLATNGAGYTIFGCNASRAALEAVPASGKIWINCTSGSETFNTAGLNLNAGTVFFNAKQVAANNLSLPGATRVYIRGDTATNGTALSVSSTTFRMHHGGATSCADTTIVPSTSRARLVIGAGSIFSNSGGEVALCGTTVVLRGGSTTGCIPTTSGTAPASTSCNGRISLGGPTDWTAPSTTPNQVTDTTLYSDLEDLALWSEAAGSYDVGGGGAMHLSGVFFLPNGEFKVHGGASQDVKNSQYIARKFRADGGSNLDMAPNPYDVVTIPVVGGFALVR